MDRNSNSHDEENSQQEYWQAAQEMMAAGEQAAQLLNSPVFNVAYRAQMEDTINQWLTSEPKEQNKRDSLYYQAQAQVAMATRMQSFVEQAQRLHEEQRKKQDPKQQRAEYLETQGFGVQ